MQLAAVAIGAWIIVVGAACRIPEKGDFVQFYTLGSIAAAGRYQELFSDRLLHAEQVALTGDVGHYPPVYGPQVALALQPLSWFPFAIARVLLAGLGVAVTLWLTLWLVRFRPVLIPWRTRIAVLTIGAPITLYVGITSHLSFVALGALAACAFGLERQSRIIAGIALGLLGYKPSLAVPAIAVVAIAGEGTIACLALAVAVAGPVLALPIVGIDVVQQYAARLWTLAQAPGQIANPALMASLSTFWTSLLPVQGARVAYAVSGGLAVCGAAFAWRRRRDPLERMAALGLAIALAAPHLYFYDLLILAPAFLLWGAEGTSSRGAMIWLAAMYFCPLLGPLVVLTHVQVVTIVLAGSLVATIVGRPVIGSGGAVGKTSTAVPPLVHGGKPTRS
jgi:alpha-1,2-mannosyltransferase